MVSKAESKTERVYKEEIKPVFEATGRAEVSQEMPQEVRRVLEILKKYKVSTVPGEIIEPEGLRVSLFKADRLPFPVIVVSRADSGPLEGGNLQVVQRDSIDYESYLNLTRPSDETWVPKIETISLDFRVGDEKQTLRLIRKKIPHQQMNDSGEFRIYEWKIARELPWPSERIHYLDDHLREKGGELIFEKGTVEPTDGLVVIGPWDEISLNVPPSKKYIHGFFLHGEGPDVQEV